MGRARQPVVIKLLEASKIFHPSFDFIVNRHADAAGFNQVYHFSVWYMSHLIPVIRQELEQWVLPHELQFQLKFSMIKIQTPKFSLHVVIKFQISPISRPTIETEFTKRTYN